MGHAMAEKIRERLDPDTVIDLAFEVASDTSLPSERRLAALYGLVDRGFTKPAVDTNINVSATQPTNDFSHLSIERRLELMAEIRGTAAIDATESHDPRLLEPSVHDDE